MVTTVGHETELPELLQNLVWLNLDAIEAYEAAIEKLDDAKACQRLGEFMADHRRHIEELTPHLTGLGRDVPTDPSAKRLLTEGKIRIAAMAGDNWILTAMATNEIETEAAYSTAADRDDLTPQLADKLAAARDDETRHKQWMQERAG